MWVGACPYDRPVRRISYVPGSGGRKDYLLILIQERTENMWVGASPCVRPRANEPCPMGTGRTQGDAPTHHSEAILVSTDGPHDTPYPGNDVLPHYLR